MKMNPEVKARWVAALRSGEYEQGHGFLNENGKFCCLGVLCDLHAKEGLGAWDGERYGVSATIPPESVAEWAGLSPAYPNPEVHIGGAHWFVAKHNDEGRTFAEIAAAIEEQL